MVSETTLKGCNKNIHGLALWTAGQRIDPSSQSQFVWRVTSSDGPDTVSTMTYTNWYPPNEPNYSKVKESCMEIWLGRSYTWNDDSCESAYCSVCELDM